MKREFRDYRHFPVNEVRVVDKDGKQHITGRAIAFESMSEDLGGFREIIPADVEIEFDTELVSLFNHDANQILGRVPGTLTVQRTDGGILYDVDPPDSPVGQTVLRAIERGDVRGNSFQFQTVRDTWQETLEGKVRTLRQIRVAELGPVVFPAYRETDVTVAMRSLERWREVEQKVSAAELRRRDLALL